MMCDATSPPQMYSVHLINDNFNMREYVARVLMMVCDISESQADSIMMSANWEYSALIGEWEKPIAEHIHEGMTKAGLQAAIRQADAVDD